jgi:hypothetical protein
VVDAARVDTERVDGLAVSGDLERRQVNDHIEAAVHVVENGWLRNVGLDQPEGGIGQVVGHVVEPTHRQIVDPHHLVALGEQAIDQM